MDGCMYLNFPASWRNGLLRGAYDKSYERVVAINNDYDRQTRRESGGEHVISNSIASSLIRDSIMSLISLGWAQDLEHLPDRGRSGIPGAPRARP